MSNIFSSGNIMKHLFYIIITLLCIPLSAQQSETAKRMQTLGFVDIAKSDTSIRVELMYARPDNFTGRILYKNLREGYLHPNAMKGLIKAQRELKRLHPGYRLIVYDAARPMSVQQQMWNVVRGTSKDIYVSNPARGGGLHNYGLAVDISILDEKEHPLPMGTKVDHLGVEAHITHEAGLVQKGKITEKERKNRLLLRQVMRSAGFRALPTEWWHFNWCSREEAKRKYKIIP